MSIKIHNSLLILSFLLIVGAIKGQSRLYYETGQSIVNRFNHKLALYEYDDNIYLTDINSILEFNKTGTLLNVCNLFTNDNASPLYYERDSVGELLVKIKHSDEISILKQEGHKNDFASEKSWLQNYEIDFSSDIFKGPGFIKKVDGNYFLIDKNQIQIIDAQTGDLIIIKENPYGQPATIVFDNQQYLLPVSSGNNPLIGAIDENGSSLWEKSYNGIKRFGGLKKTTDGFIAIGESNNGAFLLKLNQEVDSMWLKYFVDMSIHDIVASTDMGFALIGEKSGKVYLIKTDSLGNIQWEEEYGEGMGLKIIQTEDEGYAIGARFRDRFTYFIKTDKNGQTSQAIKKHLPFYGILEPNNIRSAFSADGLQFFNNSSEFKEIHFEAPNNSNKNTIYGGGLWLGGKDFFGNSYTTAEYYGMSDFEPGISLDSTAFFNQIWQVYASEIQTFRTDFSDGIIDDGIPYNILKYPAKGNPNATDFSGLPYTINRDLAPFIDVNKDSLYNPMDGDYPAIKGDHALWWVVNDANLHPYTRGVTMDIEVQYMAYGYNQPENPLLHNTIFVEAHIKNNHDVIDYPEFYMGQRIHFEIGCLEDDFVGCYPEGHFFYGYNADDNDAQDETCIPLFGNDTTIAYGNEIPVQTATLLDNDLSSFTYFQNEFAAINDTFVRPFKMEEHFNILTGKWKDGTPLTEGGLGYSSTNENNTFFAFSGNPANEEEWSMCTIDEKILDPEFVGSTGPHFLPVGNSIKFSMAYTYFEDVPHPCPDIRPIARDLETLRCFYNTGNVENMFTVNLGKDTILKDGKSFVLDAGEKGVSYEWSTQESSQQITVTESGRYTVTVTAENGCEIIDEIGVWGIRPQVIGPAINVLQEIGIDKTSEKHFSIAPNPSSEIINITLSPNKAVPNNGQLQLFNSLGQKVWEKAINIKKGIKNDYIIPVKALTPGTYFLHLNAAGQLLERQKVLVIR